MPDTFPLHPRDLGWDEVDPARHPFDRETVRAVVRSLEPASRVPSGTRNRFGRLPDTVAWPWANEMAEALVAHYGRWVVGWRWVASEGDFGGGPVHGWCCASDSIGEPAETLDRIAGCVVEWRAWLEDLAGRFARFPVRDVPPGEREEMWERAVVHLITHAVEVTDGNDAWYETAVTALRWFLAAAGIDRGVADRLVEEATMGRFTSWIGPDPATVADVGEHLAFGVLLAEEADGA